MSKRFSFNDHLYRRLETDLESIPLARPDLLQAAAKKQYKVAAAYAIFATANYIGMGYDYGPEAIQPAIGVANFAGFLGGTAGMIWHGMKGVLKQTVAETISFDALDQQLATQDDDESSHER